MVENGFFPNRLPDHPRLDVREQGELREKFSTLPN